MFIEDGFHHVSDKYLAMSSNIFCDFIYFRAFVVVVVQSLSCVQLFVTPWIAACPAPLSFTVSWSLLKLMSIESATLSNYLILCWSLLLLPSIFPSIRVFSTKLALCIWYQSIEAPVSASVLPMNIQGWFLLELTGLISLVSKGLSRAFSSISSLAHSLLYGSALTSVHGYCKDHSFDYMNFCWQSDVSAF